VVPEVPGFPEVPEVPDGFLPTHSKLIKERLPALTTFTITITIIQNLKRGCL
jgi:hypothetical protein